MASRPSSSALSKQQQPPPRPPPEPPARRRRVVAGLAAEAAAQAEQAQRARDGDQERPNELAGSPMSGASRNGGPPARGGTALVAVKGACRCGGPATSTCAAGCARPTCPEHLLAPATRLAWPGPYQSEREHTAYLRAFKSNPSPLCAWCREAAGVEALAALPPVPPLPGDVLQRLTVLLRHPHDYPKDAWHQTVRAHGGAAAVVRLLGPRVVPRRPAQELQGRTRRDVLVGVSVGGSATPGTSELLDHSGVVWTVRPLGKAPLRKHRAWVWERAADERVAQLLPGLLEWAGL